MQNCDLFAGETRFFPEVAVAQLFSFRKYPKGSQT